MSACHGGVVGVQLVLMDACRAAVSRWIRMPAAASSIPTALPAPQQQQRRQQRKAATSRCTALPPPPRSNLTT